MVQAYVLRRDVPALPDTVKRVVLITNGQSKPPKGWHEVSGAMHLGAGKWLVPIERDVPPTEGGERG
jgi:hypothetical protein